MSNEKKNLRSLSSEQIEAFFSSISQPKFRARQIEQWLWQKQAKSFEDMTNLPLELRSTLEESFVINQLTVPEEQVTSYLTELENFLGSPCYATTLGQIKPQIIDVYDILMS